MQKGITALITQMYELN